MRPPGRPIPYSILPLAEQAPRFVLEFLRRTAITRAKRLAATRVQLLEACPGIP